MYTEEQLDFAYKYPFSEEAKSVVKSLDLKSVDRAHVLAGKSRLEEALKNDRLEYRESNYGKLDFLLGYVYARMLTSALRNSAIVRRFATAESKRATDALELDSDSSILRIAKELGLAMTKEEDDYVIRFAAFLKNMPTEEGFSLSNQRLGSGNVVLDKHQVIKVLGVAIRKAIERGLPIKQESIPRIVLDYAKDLKIQVKPIAMPIKGLSSVSWIDKLLQTPIPDCRHRTVNLILAPYLVNSKGLSVEQALEIISNYITLCKTVNADTKITDRYIKYQCEWAKKHGLRPLSLRRARVELSAIDFNLLLGEDKLVESE
jgi:hypothetical protein